MMRPLAVTAGILALSLGASAQEFIVLPDGSIVTQGGTVTAPGVPAQAPDGTAGAPEPESPRQLKLKTLQYDRRPSAILKAWSTPPKPADEEEADEPVEETPPIEDVPVEDAPVDDGTAAGDPVAGDPVTGDPVAGTGEAPPTAEPEKTPEELAAEAEAARLAEEAAAEAARLAAETEEIEAEVKALQRNVTLGNWDDVHDYLARLTEAEAKAGYQALLKSLVAGPKKPQSQFVQYAETNYFGPEDVTGLAAAAAHELEDADLTGLGQILRQCTTAGSLVEHCIELFRGGLASDEPPLERTEVARILFGANYPVDAGEFLPEPDVAIGENDRASLNLLARHYLALHAKEKKSGHLEEAWKVTQAVLASGEVEDEVKEEALARAVDIAPRIREELGQAWLDESFTSRPERGMEILNVIGSAASTGMMLQARDSDQRFKGLQLSTTAANALLAAAPELADEWAPTLNLLAANWLKEAEYTRQYDQSTARGPIMQRDPYGNFFYNNYRPSFNRNMPLALTTDQMLDIRPSDAWLELVVDGLKPKFAMIVAQLLLKVNEENEAFPYIERLALSHPDLAVDLVEEFLRIWARNHNPNSNNSRTNQYMFIYGFEQRSNAIPLTRSKQERNLAELSEWVTRLRALPIEDIDESLIANAFTAAHSTAEVYRLDTIEHVFGDLRSLEPETLAALVQRMRSNLVGVWRQPAVQKDKKTRRRQKDIQAEVMRGYEVARNVIEQGLDDHPENWSLVLAGASLKHDENNYRQEVAKDSEFAGRREEAFAEFKYAADLYLASAGELTEEEEKVDAFVTWFYASLGACDLNAIDHEKQPAQAEIEKIRASLAAFPADAADRHMGMFANTLFTRMSSVNPAVKFRYVRAGLEITGEHERAKDAREIYDYYRDLVTEIRFEAEIDGQDRVGHGEPFGLFVNLRHTREIERESGGFGKYLVNQNNQVYAYNYGRPTEDYRDKFEESTREALSEHFEVQSITFNHPDVHSRAEEEYGWRVTPYAYVLLKARGPEVDRIPSMRLDLDFLDTTGYAVLPVETAPVAIDATAIEAAERPFAELEVTQTLDERQSDQGKLLLEIKARGLGLVPSLDQVLELAPEDFDVVSTEDQGVSVSKFDEESDDVAVRSDRTWVVRLQAKGDLTELPDSFEFARPLVEAKEVEYQRYVDADLESVESVVALEARYGETKGSPLLGWGIAAVVLLGLGTAGFVVTRRSRGEVGPARRFEMPEKVSPFTVIGLLRDIEARNGVSDAQRRELIEHIERLEGHYFEDDGRDAPDIRRIAEDWIGRVS